MRQKRNGSFLGEEKKFSGKGGGKAFDFWGEKGKVLNFSCRGGGGTLEIGTTRMYHFGGMGGVQRVIGTNFPRMRRAREGEFC